jgi:hypothetical protein
MERQTRNMSHSLENQSPDGEMANLFSDEALLNPSTTEPTIAKLSPTSHSETLSTSQLEATSDPFVTTTNSSSTSHPETTNKAQLQALKSALKDLLFSQPSAQSSAHQYFQYQETRRDLAEKIRRLEATIRREEAAAKRGRFKFCLVFSFSIFPSGRIQSCCNRFFCAGSASCRN